MSVLSPQDFIVSLAKKLDRLYQQKATGELKFYDSPDKVAIMFLLGGRLQYFIPVKHRFRHWQRAVFKHCPHWQQPKTILKTEPWESDFIYQGVSKKQVGLDEAKSIITMVTKEALFELSLLLELTVEWEEKQREKSTFSYFLSLAPEDIHSILQDTKNQQRRWEQYKLQSLNPCIAPTILDKGKAIIKQPLQLKYLGGEYTMWDFAVKSKQPIVEVGRTLQQWQQKGLIDFHELDDLPFLIKDSRHQTQEKKPPVTVYRQHPTPSRVNISGENNTAEQFIPHKTANSVKNHHGKYLVACIDDSSIIIHTLSKILIPAGFNVLGITEPMAGFAQLLEHQPDLILLDLNMPNANGYSVCKFLRESPVFAKTPIVILTAQDRSIDRAKAKLVGATDFLHKPPEADKLISLINHYIEEQKTKVG